MRNLFKRILSVTLILALLVNGSLVAFASQQTGGIAINTTTQQTYDDISLALLAASAGDTVKLCGNASATVLNVLSDVQLDLNGYTLESAYVSCFGNIVDNSDDGTGLLKVAEDRLLIRKNNTQLPVNTADGYRFLNVSKFNTTYLKDSAKFAFQPFIDANAHDLLTANLAATDVSIEVRVSWQQENGIRSQNFVFNADFVATYLASYSKTGDTEKYGKMFTLTLTGVDDFEQLTFEAIVSSGTGVEFAADPITVGDDSTGGDNEGSGNGGGGNEGSGSEGNTPSNVLITNAEFLYGSYFDHDRVGHNNRITSGAYGAIKSADALHPAQDITIKVTDTNLANYKVTLGFFDKDGNYTGRTGILPMVNGELTIKASEMTGKYFRVNVYIYTGQFPKVPESAEIVVYKGQTAQPEQPDTPDTPDTPSNPDSSERPWEGKKIAILGDSISTGGYPGMLANMTGATLQNLSVSGTLLAGGLTGKVADVASDADLVIVFGGTNDYWHKNVQIGAADSTDARTYVGALRYILNSLKTNNPNAKYLFVFPADQTFGGNPSSTDFGKGSLDDFRAAFLKFCAENNVHYVNLADTEFDSSKHSGDGVHPNTTGHQIIAQAIYDKIATGLKTTASQ